MSQGPRLPLQKTVIQPAPLAGLGTPTDFDLRVASQPIALLQAADGKIWFAAYTLGAWAGSTGTPATLPIFRWEQAHDPMHWPKRRIAALWRWIAP